MSDLETLAKLMRVRYVERVDMFARQNDDGSYKPVRRRMTAKDLIAHIEGDSGVTYGHYVVDPETDRCRCICFDVDFDKVATLSDGSVVKPRLVLATEQHSAAVAELNRTIRAIADGLAARFKRLYPKWHVSLAFSGSKGVHVYASPGSRADAGQMRRVAIDFMKSWGFFEATRGENFYQHTLIDIPIQIEVYPKQDSVNKSGFGNLLRLPLGVNRKSGRRGFFYEPAQDLDKFTPASPLDALARGLDLRSLAYPKANEEEE